MVLKRGSSELPDLPDREVKRQHFPATAYGKLEIAVQEFLQELDTPIGNLEREEIGPFWSAFGKLQIAVQESMQELEREEIGPFWRPSQNQIESSGSRTLQLRFDCELPATIFTGNRILSEDRKPVKIVLYDSGSKNIITSGSLSSLKVNVVVLDGDFSPHDQNNWTEREFVSKIVPSREGKRPLVTGELIVYLEEGVCYIGDANFTDNSSWIRSGKFRLGVKINANYNIREGVSGAFKVKDHRGESYQKHYPPSLGDEVWRLEKIAKDGVSHKRLAKSGISTVGDFLRSYDTNPSSLRSLLKISHRRWAAIIEHAKTCKLDDDKLYPSIGADNVNYPSSSMQNANFPVERGSDMATVGEIVKKKFSRLGPDLEEKTNDLQRKVELLESRKHDVQEELGGEAAYLHGKKCKREIEYWLSDVECITRGFEILKREVVFCRVYKRQMLTEKVEQVTKEVTELLARLMVKEEKLKLYA